MERFSQLMWTSDYPVLDEVQVPSIDSAWDPPAEYPIMEGSFTDIPMADFPPPPPLQEEHVQTLVNLDHGHAVQIEDRHRVTDFDPGNIPAGNVWHVCFLVIYTNFYKIFQCYDIHI